MKPFLLGSFVVPLVCVNIKYVKKNVNENTLEILSHLLAMKTISKTHNEITSQIKLFSVTIFLYVFKNCTLA